MLRSTQVSEAHPSGSRFISRERTIAWAKRNCADPRVVKDVALQLDRAAAGAGHLILVFGKKLTQSRTTYLVASWHREMFAFELTARQARHLGAEPNALGALIRRLPPDGKLIVPDEPAVLMTDLHIDHQDAQQPTAPVTGHVTYQSSLPMLNGVVVRMMFDLPGGSTVSHYHHPVGPIAGAGTLRFKLTPLVNDMVKPSRDMPGTLPVFISFCRQEPPVHVEMVDRQPREPMPSILRQDSNIVAIGARLTGEPCQQIAQTPKHV